VLSASGRIDPEHPALAAGALVLTTDEGEALLAGTLPSSSTVQALGTTGPLDPHRVVSLLHERGHRLILSEGGPHAIGPFFQAGLVDELFLTLSPLLLGRDLGEIRLSLVEGEDLLPGGPARTHLLGIRRADDHVFLRYGFEH
jgi:riboflavin biosynthesis pyrimidine reductase